MKKISLLFSFVLLTCFYACEPAEESVNVAQDRIYTIYELNYSHTSDKTIAKAFFKFGSITGTQLSLSEGSVVSFNGELLPKRVDPVTNITSYEKEYAGFVKSGEFSWKDTEGKEYKNTVTIKNTITIPADFNVVERDKSLEFSWDGDVLEKDEKVILTLFGVNVGNFQLFSQGQKDAKGMVLEKNKLQELTIGEGKAVLERRLETSLDEATGAGGVKWAVYFAEDKKIELK